MAQRIVGVRHVEREFALQVVDGVQPRAARLRVDLRQQLLQHLADVGMDRHVGLFDLAQLGAVDIHVNNGGVRAELLGFADCPIVEARAQHDQQIGLLQNEVGAARGVHAQHAQRQRVFHRHRAQRHQRHGGGQTGALGQLQRLPVSVGADDAAAQVEDGAFRLIDHRGGLRNQRRIEARGGVRHGDRRQLFQGDGGGLHVFRHIDPDRAGAAGLGDAERVANHLRQLADIAHQMVVLGDRDGNAVGIHFLEGVCADHRGRHLPGDAYQRNGVELGIGDGGDQVGGARPAGGDAHRRFAVGARHALRHKARALFVARQHVVNAGALAQRVIQRQRRAARDAGDGGDALTLQQMNDQLCAGEAGTRLRRARSCHVPVLSQGR